MIRRTLEDRLFPILNEVMGWEISAQADRAGYACSPREKLDALESYETVEVLIRSPWGAAPDLSSNPAFSRFSPLDGTSCVTAGNVPVSELNDISSALIQAVMQNPNFGCPRGHLSWPGKTIYHGTDSTSAQDIVQNGVDLSQCERGYFGLGFYAADVEETARSNYADFSGESGGDVVQAEIVEGANILDMRNWEDQRVWAAGGFSDRAHLPAFPKEMRMAGIDGVYDRSFGGVVIYNPSCLQNIRTSPSPEREDALDF